MGFIIGYVFYVDIILLLLIDTNLKVYQVAFNVLCTVLFF